MGQNSGVSIETYLILCVHKLLYHSVISWLSIGQIDITDLKIVEVI